MEKLLDYYQGDNNYRVIDASQTGSFLANSFTASKKDFDKFVKREEFINSVMWGYNIPIVTHDNFVKDQDSELKRIAEFYGIKGNFLEENKKPVILNPDYTKIFTNYREIEKWFTQYQK